MESRARTWFFIGALIILSIVAFGFGIYAYERGKVSDKNITNVEKLAKMENMQDEEVNVVENSILETSSTNANISPNAIVIEKRYYESCDHLIRDTIDIPEELINQGEDAVKKYYFGWTVEEYSPTEIVVYKEFKGICNEHYVVKENDGVLGIYIEDEEGIQEWLEDTEIEVQYLPEEDAQEFKVGVKVVGKTNLNTFLEDYE